MCGEQFLYFSRDLFLSQTTKMGYLKKKKA